MSHELPLFPLDTVLFPGIPLKLHIFEQRYKQMINRCLEEAHSFGVVLIQEGAESGAPLALPYHVGCTAEIIAVDQLKDGQMNITTVGAQRFRVISLNYDQPYLVGQIETFPFGVSDPEAVKQEYQRLRPWVKQYLRILADAGQVDFDPDQLPSHPLALGCLAAHLLQIPLERKQDLLAAEQAAGLMAALRNHYRRESALLATLLQPPAVEGPEWISAN